MFVESELTWTIAVKPSDLKSDLHIQRALLVKLLADFDKLQCSEKHGYYICVTTLEGIGEGKIWEGRGFVAFKVRFRCLTYKPQRGEKVFAVVTGEPQAKGVICSFGPMDNMFLSAKLSNSQYTFVGASETKPSHFKGKDGSVIETGSVLRVEIIGVKYNSLSRIYDTVSSVNGHYLGVERRTWEDTSKPQAAAAGDEEWNTTLGGDGKDAGAWGCDTHDEDSGRGWGAAAADKTNGAGTWDALPAKSSGGRDDFPVEKAGKGGDWDASPAKKSGKGGDWGGDTVTESAAAWDSQATKKTGGGVWDASPIARSGGDWDASPVKKSGKVGGWGGDTVIENTGAWVSNLPEKSSDVGCWGDDSPEMKDCGRRSTASGEKSKGNVDSGIGTHPDKEDTGGWAISPVKKNKVDVWNSTISEKPNSDDGAWGDPLPKTSSGDSDTMEVETTVGAWGD